MNHKEIWEMNGHGIFMMYEDDDDDDDDDVFFFNVVSYYLGCSHLYNAGRWTNTRTNSYGTNWYSFRPAKCLIESCGDKNHQK